MAVEFFIVRIGQRRQKRNQLATRGSQRQWLSAKKANRASVLETVRFVINQTTGRDGDRGGVSNYP